MSPLHHLGDLLREWLLLVPLEAARGLFLLLIAAVLVAVLWLPRPEPEPGQESRARGLGGNLKVWAVLALLIQIAVYLVF